MPATVIASLTAAVVFLFLTLNARRHRPAVESLDGPAPSQVSRPGRTPLRWLLVAIGPLMILAGLLVILWPQAPSDCHGSPVCALDGFAVIGQWFMGGLVMACGLVWFLIAAAATAVHRSGVNDPTRQVQLPPVAVATFHPRRDQ